MSDIASALFALSPDMRDSAQPGNGYIMIRCPFHGGGQENTPSCSVSIDKPVFFCHACQESGHISRILKSLGLGKDAVQAILKSTGLDSPSVQTARGRLAARLVTHGNVFRGRYILDEDILDEFRQAPRDLLRKGFAKTTLRHFEVGYDLMNLRMTFPIRNVYGELVGISGRALVDGVEPRYKIYDRELKTRKDFHVPEDYTMEEVKDAVLWHAHVVRPFLYKFTDEALVITEGFKACMWTWQSGYQTTVALIGAYLSGLHAELISTVVQYVVLFLDNNDAGWRGTFHAGNTLAKHGIDVRVARYPDDRGQPDDLSSEEVRLSIKNSVPYILWRQDHGRFVHEAALRSWRRQHQSR